MKFIKKHKKGIIIAVVIIVLLVLFLVFVHTLMPDTGKSVWGSRLSGIDEHPISDEMIDKVKEVVKNDGKVNDITYRLSGRTMNFIITVNEGVSRNDASALVGYFYENIDAEVKSYYDIELYFKSIGDDSTYPFMAYKHKTRDTFSFTYAG